MKINSFFTFKRGVLIRRISIIVLVAFLLTGNGIPLRYVSAQETLAFSETGIAFQEFAPPLLTGIKVYRNDPFRFDFILDTGDAKESDQQLKTDSNRLIKYFLASLTVPEKDLWVNLSPYEKNRIVPDAFGKTEMGRDLLAQDYILKQITASLIYPENEIGKKFWDKVYAEALKRYGTTDIPVDTFNKVWIIPEKATVCENKDSAYVVESKLKVMLEEDYLALEKNVATKKHTTSATNKLGSDIVREIVIPILEKEVNEGKNFSQLRQVYYSLILATWYKRKVKNSIISQAYVDQKKTVGIDIADKNEKEKIWQQYVQAFKKGAYNLIKEEYDPATQQTIPRKYFSGGTDLAMTSVFKAVDLGELSKIPSGKVVVVQMRADMAMNSDEEKGDTEGNTVSSESESAQAATDTKLNKSKYYAEMLLSGKLKAVWGNEEELGKFNNRGQQITLTPSVYKEIQPWFTPTPKLIAETGKSAEEIRILETPEFVNLKAGIVIDAIFNLAAIDAGVEEVFRKMTPVSSKITKEYIKSVIFPLAEKIRNEKNPKVLKAAQDIYGAGVMIIEQLRDWEGKNLLPRASASPVVKNLVFIYGLLLEPLSLSRDFLDRLQSADRKYFEMIKQGQDGSAMKDTAFREEPVDASGLRSISLKRARDAFVDFFVWKFSQVLRFLGIKYEDLPSWQFERFINEKVNTLDFRNDREVQITFKVMTKLLDNLQRETQQIPNRGALAIDEDMGGKLQAFYDRIFKEVNDSVSLFDERRYEEWSRIEDLLKEKIAIFNKDTMTILGVIVFGSWAKGTASQTSDVDYFLVFAEKKGRVDIFEAFKKSLNDKKLPYEFNPWQIFDIDSLRLPMDLIRGNSIKPSWKIIAANDEAKKQIEASLVSEWNQHIASLGEADTAQLAVNNGGIDFNPESLELKEMNGVGGVNLNFDSAMLQRMQNASGINPVIINIKPVDLKMFLGLVNKEDVQNI